MAKRSVFEEIALSHQCAVNMPALCIEKLWCTTAPYVYREPWVYTGRNADMNCLTVSLFQPSGDETPKALISWTKPKRSGSPECIHCTRQNWTTLKHYVGVSIQGNSQLLIAIHETASKNAQFYCWVTSGSSNTATRYVASYEVSKSPPLLRIQYCTTSHNIVDHPH